MASTDTPPLPTDAEVAAPPSPSPSSSTKDLTTPPASPRPDHYGSTTSPVSPAVSVESTQLEQHQQEQSSAAAATTTTTTEPKKGRKKAFLFRILSGKKKKAAEKAGLAPPSLAPKTAAAAAVNVNVSRASTPEPQIDWLENKEQKKTTKTGLFASFRQHKDKNGDKTVRPKGNWSEKKQPTPEPLTPKQPSSSPGRKKKNEAAAAAVSPSPPASPKPHSEKIDNIVVEETYVNEDDNNGAAAPKKDVAVKKGQDATLLARRKAIVQDSWDFYRLICSLVCDRDRYHETFRTMQKDPVYPYLNSLTSVNDPYNVGYENFDKAVVQADEEDYKSMTKMQVAEALEQKAHETLSEFVEVCKAIAGSLGVEELGIGPIKEAATALRKAQRKYDGDLLKVTDFCRALIIVDDFAALLGLLELIRDSYGEMIRRVKLSTLKNSQPPKVGGYRDCIINMEINGHICELQVHLKPMWEICRTKGYKHYVHSLEYKTDSFRDAYASLKGLDRKTLRELLALADDVTQPHPLDNVGVHEEKIIMDYFAMAGLYYKVGSYSFGEIYFSRLFEMRKESMGVLHPQTDFVHRYYVACLRKQRKEKEANLQESSFALEKANAQKAEREESQQENATAQQKAQEQVGEQPEEIPGVGASASFWDALSDSITQGTNSAYNLIVDPNRKVREEEQAAKAKVRNSKHVWRAIRRERYPFLEGVIDEQEDDDDEETREGVEEAVPEAAPAVAKEEPKAESTSLPVEKPKEEPSKADTSEKKETATENETKKEPVKSEASASELVEEKKEDGGETTTDMSKDGEPANEKAIVAEDEAPSAFIRLMDQACSLCAPNTASSS